MNRSFRLFPLAADRGMRLWLLLALLVAITQLTEPLSNPTPTESVIFWTGRVLGFLAGFVMADHILHHWAHKRFLTPAWLKPVLIATLLAAGPLTLAEMGVESVTPQRDNYDDSSMPTLLAYLAEYVTIVSIVFPLNLGLWFLIDARKVQEVQPAVEEPVFLRKTRGGVKAADVLALEADEHYVKVHTARGTEMIHHRLGDATGEMPGHLGLRVHRSWWVADRAVVAATRSGKRHQLLIENDLLIPVSASHSAEVRNRGLLHRKSIPTQSESKS